MYDKTVIAARRIRECGGISRWAITGGTFLVCLATLGACSAPVTEPDEAGVRALLADILSDTPGVDTQLDEFTLYGCQESRPEERRCDVSYTYTVTQQADGDTQTNSDGGVIIVRFVEGAWQLAD